MQITKLSVKNVRNIQSSTFKPGNTLNFIVGPNASGKTALLEAIYMLSRAKSFRTPRASEIIQKGENSLSVSASMSYASKGTVSTGIEKTRKATEIRFNGASLKTVSEQATNIPLIVITPDSQDLATGSPKGRRHWMDWALFHVEHKYMELWKNYHKNLRHRNILLKKQATDAHFSVWEEKMVLQAEKLSALRSEFVNRMNVAFSNNERKCLAERVELLFSSGGSSKHTFSQYLNEKREDDRRLGFTRHGPHKADVLFKSDEHLLATVFSRGQIKLFIADLLLTQAKVFAEQAREKPVLIVDDYAAELDLDARGRFLEALRTYGGQVFVTTTETRVNNAEAEDTVFHVKHGVFEKVVE